MGMEGVRMAKIKIAKILVVLMASLVASLIFSSGNSYARVSRGTCLAGGKYIKVKSEAKINNKPVYTRVGDLGYGPIFGFTETYGSGVWACERPNDRNRAVLFFASDVVEESDKKTYSIYTDVEVDLNSTNNPAYVVGMVNGSCGDHCTNYAVFVSYCINRKDCSGHGSNKPTNANGIIASFESEVLRRKKEDPRGGDYGDWNAPKHKSEVVIDGLKLRENWSALEELNQIKTLDNGKILVILYLHRCFSYDGESAEKSSCGRSPIYLMITDTTHHPPTSTSCDSTNSYSNSGKSGVRKNGGSFAYTNNNSGAVSTWAKPGDSIQFTHTTCAAAQKLIDDNQAFLGSYDSNYAVSANTTNGTNGKGYIFGNDLSGNSSAKISNITLKNNDYDYTANSPSDDAGSAYSCDGIYGGFTSGHYQIPGLKTRTEKCNSSKKTVASDVGNAITQTLTWRDFDIRWQTIYHEAEWDEDGNLIKPRTSENVPYVNSSTDYSTSASVYVPYNYILKPYVESKRTDGESQIATIGGELDFTAYVPVDVRENKQVGDTYATHTKDTKIKIVSFVLDSNGQPTSSTTYHANNGSASIDNICNYATASGRATHCEEVAEKNITLNYNSSGNTSGTLGNDKSIENGGSRLNLNGVKAAVPEDDISLGDKICVAVATWPSDSHNLGDAATVDNYNQSIALTGNAGANAKWAVSAPNCATITKRPIFSVESSQLSATGKIVSSTYTRNKLTFSSWAEYIIATSAKNGVVNTASGAATAYIEALGLDSLFIPNKSKYAIASREVNLASTRAGTKSAETFTAQTMLNSGKYTPGYATKLELAENIEKFYTAIENIYTRKGKTSPQPGAGIANFEDLRELKGSTKLTVKDNYYDISIRTSSACVYDEEKGYYVVHDNDARLGKDKKGNPTAPYYCLSNGAKYYHVNKGNAYLGGGGRNNTGGYVQIRLTVDDLDGSGGQETFRNQTTVVHVNGTLVIDTNFVIAYNDNGRRMIDRFTNIQQLPQLIFIADNIDITNNVSRIDAWLIAKNKINTCAYDDYNGFIRNNYISSAVNGGLNANRCNKELIVNGPVVTREIALNRTAGAGTVPAEYNNRYASLRVDDAYYVVRGEIFNLRSDAYLWGYYQAQRNGVLTTVYSKELPTRY